MTIRELEKKCAILAQTPQVRWFDLRFKAFVTMINNSDLGMLVLDDLFPIAKAINFVGFCIKVENDYYFLLASKTGMTYECFNVENMDFNSPYDNILSSRIILSSDDDSNRATFLPFLMKGMNRSELKTKLDNLFSTAEKSSGGSVL